MAASAALQDVGLGELMRLQHMETAPRGVVLLVGCVGVLLDMCDDVPAWEGCRQMLKGHALRAKRPQLRLRVPGQAPPAGSFWQRLERFDAANVGAAQRAAVMEAIGSDLGGLMQPHHLE